MKPPLLHACTKKSISLFLNSPSIECFPLLHLCILTCLFLSSTAPSQGPEQAHEQVPQPLRSENPRAQIARVILSMHKQAPFAQYTVPFLVHRTGSVVGDRYVYTHIPNRPTPALRMRAARSKIANRCGLPALKRCR